MDGTGNAHKVDGNTNVLDQYGSFDLTDADKQVACHTPGVGRRGIDDSPMPYDVFQAQNDLARTTLKCMAGAVIANGLVVAEGEYEQKCAEKTPDSP